AGGDGVVETFIIHQHAGGLHVAAGDDDIARSRRVVEGHVIVIGIDVFGRPAVPVGGGVVVPEGRMCAVAARPGLILCGDEDQANLAVGIFHFIQRAVGTRGHARHTSEGAVETSVGGNDVGGVAVGVAHR